MRAANLHGFAYTTLPADDPARLAYRAVYLANVTRHLTIKAEVAPLIAAWRAAGIEVLLWKGFYLAEFVYPVPGARFHGDVDALLHPRDVQMAGRIAAELGWVGLRDRLSRPVAFRHNAYALIRPEGATLLDVHRYVVHRALPCTMRQGRVTRAVWNRSIDKAWEGTTVRLPHPVDAALVCLLLHRAWGSDRWGLKLHDLLDFRYLAERQGVSRTALEARAAELGCRRTLAAILERCDPWSGRFVPGLPAPRRSWSLDLRTLPEHVPYGIEQWLGRVPRIPAAFYDIIRALPLVARVRRAARSQSDLRRLLATLTPPMPAVRSSVLRRALFARGICGVVRLMPSRKVGACVIRSLALYRGLRKQGWAVEFVSGVQPGPDGVIGHAWVELDGTVLPELCEPQNRKLYRVNFRYPGANGSSCAPTSRTP